MHVINNAKLQFIKLWLIALEMTHDAAQGFDSPLEGLNANNEPSHWVLWDLFGFWQGESCLWETNGLFVALLNNCSLSQQLSDSKPNIDLTVLLITLINCRSQAKYSRPLSVPI